MKQLNSSMNYSTLQPHKNYRYPSEQLVDEALEILGYNYYLPTKILSDLICLYSHHMAGRLTDNILNKGSLTDELYEFYSTLSYDLYMGNNPLEKAIITLKQLSKELDLRQMEIGLDFKRKAKNLISKPDNTTELILQHSETELTHEAEALLVKMLLKFKKNLPTISEEVDKETVKTRMKTFQEIFNAKKSVLVRPDFKYKLVNKQLIVEAKKDLKREDDVIIYLEDASGSMDKGINFIGSKGIQKLLCDDPRTVYYYRYSNKIDVYKLESYEEKVKVFSQPKTYLKTRCDYDKLFELVNKKHKKGSIIISTDGEDILPILNTSLTVYAVMRMKNREIINLCRKTGGQFMVI